MWAKIDTGWDIMMCARGRALNPREDPLLVPIIDPTESVGWNILEWRNKRNPQ